jgi:hypothetical protein
MADNLVQSDSVNEEFVSINLPDDVKLEDDQDSEERKNVTLILPDTHTEKHLSPEKADKLVSRPSVRSKIRLVTVFDRPAPEKVKPMYNIKAYTRGIIDATFIISSFGLAIYLAVDRSE